jgi:hypothetical protein
MGFAGGDTSTPPHHGRHTSLRGDRMTNQEADAALMAEALKRGHSCGRWESADILQWTVGFGGYAGDEGQLEFALKYRHPDGEAYWERYAIETVLFRTTHFLATLLEGEDEAPACLYPRAEQVAQQLVLVPEDERGWWLLEQVAA